MLHTRAGASEHCAASQRATLPTHSPRANRNKLQSAREIGCWWPWLEQRAANACPPPHHHTCARASPHTTALAYTVITPGGRRQPMRIQGGLGSSDQRSVSSLGGGGGGGAGAKPPPPAPPTPGVATPPLRHLHATRCTIPTTADHRRHADVQQLDISSGVTGFQQTVRAALRQAPRSCHRRATAQQRQ